MSERLNMSAANRGAFATKLDDIYTEAATAIDAYPGSTNFHTSLHGAEHSKRVLRFALLMADALALPEEDWRTLATAATYHDTQRWDDWLDVGHGARAAKAFLEDLDDVASGDELAAAIMRYHDLGDEVGEERIGADFGEHGVQLFRIFKDADGLDRYRLGPDALDERFLRTPEAKELVALSRALNGRNSPSEANTALIVIDVQNDFTTGSLGSPDAAAKVPNILAKAATFDGTVVLTQDTHGEDYLETEEGHRLPVTHCIRGTEGWQLAPGLQELAEARSWKVYEKPTFGSVALAQDMATLHERGALDSVTLVGFCTDICVVSNALLIKAFAPELKVTVDAELCAGTTHEAHEAALTTLRSCQVNVKEA